MPPSVVGFLASLPGYPAGKLFCQFHDWCGQQGIEIEHLLLSHADQYMQLPWSESFADATWGGRRLMLRRYIRWCTHENDSATDTPPPRIRGRKHNGPMPWPNSAQSFIEMLESTLRTSTCQSYKSTLQQFFNWTHSTGIVIISITRDDVIAFSRAMHAQGLAPATRLLSLIVVRSYLRYLACHDLLQADPETLIQTTDLPKLPDRLPRALRPEVDEELQQRLDRSPRLPWRGLLLMRNTGMRIGELRLLTYDCLRADHEYNYVKVPLGKLNNERLVPLDDKTLELAQKLQQQGPKPRTWLLQGKNGRPFCVATYQSALTRASYGLQEHLSKPEPITTHRLRHTYATRLLNAGMSLPGLQRLLGHRSIHMTLHYATVQLDSLTKEYFAALDNMRGRYNQPLPTTPPSRRNQTPSSLVNDAARQIHRDAGEQPKSIRDQAHRLARKLKYISAHLQDLDF